MCIIHHIDRKIHVRSLLFRKEHSYFFVRRIGSPSIVFTNKNPTFDDFNVRQRTKGSEINLLAILLV